MLWDAIKIRLVFGCTVLLATSFNKIFAVQNLLDEILSFGVFTNLSEIKTVLDTSHTVNPRLYKLFS